MSRFEYSAARRLRRCRVPLVRGKMEREVKHLGYRHGLPMGLQHTAIMKVTPGILMKTRDDKPQLTRKLPARRGLLPVSTREEANLSVILRPAASVCGESIADCGPMPTKAKSSHDEITPECIENKGSVSVTWCAITHFESIWGGWKALVTNRSGFDHQQSVALSCEIVPRRDNPRI
jgi:hypothetical protein